MKIDAQLLMVAIRKLYGEYLFLVLVLILGVGMSMGLAWNYQADSQAKTIAQFRTAAQERIGLIADKIDHSVVVLRSLGAFYRASEQVSREEFATFTKQLLHDYPYIHAVEWIPRVADQERAAYERESGYPDFTIKEAKGKSLVPSEKRAEYFPIYYVEPFVDGNVRILGFDISSDVERHRTLLHSRESRQLAATGRVELLQIKDGNAAGVVLYEPVIRAFRLKEEGREREYERLTGFVAAAVPFSSMVDAALKPLAYSGVNILIHDLSAAPDESKLLHARSTRLRDISDQEILDDFAAPAPESLREQKVMEVGGRNWEITVLSARGFFTQQLYGGTFAIILGGTFFTTLLVFYMLTRIRENERIKQQVGLRTHELSKAKRETDMILLSAHEGIIGLDSDGNVRYCNPVTCRMLGFSKRELIGRNHHDLLHAKHADGTPYDAANSPIRHVLEYGRPCTVDDEVFWSKRGEPVQVEYAAAPMIEEGEITGAVLVFRDIAERRELELKLEQMARYDQLTGLANRTLFLELLKSALLRAKRTGNKVAILYLDLNGFKPINDMLGHAAGDMLLKKFAERLKVVVRDSDVPARMGGDEFVVLVDALTQNEECIAVVQRLRKSLENPFEIAGQSFNISASIGVAFYPDHTLEHEDLIRLADEAMYRAKRDKSVPYVVHSGRKDSGHASDADKPPQSGRVEEALQVE